MNSNMSKEYNLLQFIGPLVTDFLRGNMEMPLHQILLSEAYKEEINLCPQLDQTTLTEHLKVIFIMYTKKKPGKE